MEEHVIFGDFFDLDDQSHARVYRPITDQNKIRQTLEEFYMRMNFGNTKVRSWLIVIILYLVTFVNVLSANGPKWFYIFYFFFQISCFQLYGKNANHKLMLLFKDLIG